MNNCVCFLLSMLVVTVIMLERAAQADNYYYKSSPYSSSSSAACTSNYECKNLDNNAECINGLCQCEAGFVGINIDSMTSSMQSRAASALSQPTQTVKCEPAFKLISNSVQCNLQQRCCLSATELARLNDMRCFVAPDPVVLTAYGTTNFTSYIVAASAVAGVSIDAATGEITVVPSVSLSNAMVTIGVKLNSNPPQTAFAQVTISTVTDTCCIRDPSSKNIATLLNPDFASSLVAYDQNFPSVKVLFAGCDVDAGIPVVNLDDVFQSTCDKNVIVLSGMQATAGPDVVNDDFCKVLSMPVRDPNAGVFVLIDVDQLPSSPPDPNTFSTCTFQFQVETCSGVQASILHYFIYYPTTYAAEAALSTASKGSSVPSQRPAWGNIASIVKNFKIKMHKFGKKG